MASRVLRGLSALLLTGALLTGCKHKVNFNSELPEGEVALRKLSPDEYPDFSQQMTDPAALSASCDASLKYLATPSSRNYYPYLDITHERAAASVNALKQLVLKHASHFDGAAFNSEIRSMFEVYKSKGARKPEGDGYTERVLFTGYFTPIYQASTTRQGEYVWPLYRRPNDLVVDRTSAAVVGRRAADGAVLPTYTRAEIEGKDGKYPHAGSELVYLKSHWETYIITIQGSAKLRLTDGREMEIGYAGDNGYDYTSPGKKMLEDKVIKKEQYTARGLREHFAKNPGDVKKYLWLNQRYIYFTETQGGPYGSLGVPVTPMASIAVAKFHEVRKNIYPRAMGAFLVAPVPTDESGNTRAYRGFMMDQDTGAAIRAAGRCDIYMGIGEQAEKIAGQQQHDGELYYIALKPELIPQYLPAAPAKGAAKNAVPAK